jgi:hypothetical protein
MSDNKKPIYQPWNEDEFVSSFPFRGMTHIQRWMYRTLLQSAFFYRTSPYLPNDDKVLWVLSGAESIQQWLENKEAVLGAFNESSENGQLISHHRVIADWKRVVEYRKKMKVLSDKAKAARQVFAGEPDDDRTDTEGSPYDVQTKRNDTIREGSDTNEKGEVVKVTPLSLEQFADKVGL